MTLAHLFSKCLYAPYVTVGHSADFFTERQDGNLYIYFQSSSGAEDWRNNLDFPVRALQARPNRTYYVHRGFARVFASVLPRIREAVGEAETRAVVSVGYSHGAALALLCHGYLWHTRAWLRKCIRGIGFGCPRVLWGSTPEEAVWRDFTVIRNMDDLVTHLPPALLGYRHVGRLWEIGEKGRYSGVDAHRPENIMRELLRLKGGELRLDGLCGMEIYPSASSRPRG